MKPNAVRRIPLKYWSADEAFGFVTLLVHGYRVKVIASIVWSSWLHSTMTEPSCIGTVLVDETRWPLWVYRGHLWMAGAQATKEDVLAKGAKAKARYNAEHHWWWPYVDTSMRDVMEDMDRAMFGLKRIHERAWASLNDAQRRSTRNTTKDIGVRDNRYIPQWVKIHVVLRDNGKCVYCGEADSKLLEFDHRRAWSKGGTSKDPVNICLGCQSCNRRKGDRDWGWS